MHLPGCFLLTRLFQGHPFYCAAWCRSKVFQVSPLPPPTFTVHLLCIAGTVQFFFSLLWSKEEIAVYFTKKKLLVISWRRCLGERDEPSHCPVFTIFSWLHVRGLPAHGWAHLRCWPVTFFSTVIPFFIAHSPTCGNEDCTIRQDGVYPSLFNGCQATLSFWLFGQEKTGWLWMLSFWPASQTPSYR